MYSKIWPKPSGFPLGCALVKYLGLRPYLTVYPSSRPNTDTVLPSSIGRILDTDPAGVYLANTVLCCMVPRLEIIWRLLCASDESQLSETYSFPHHPGSMAV